MVLAEDVPRQSVARCLGRVVANLGRQLRDDHEPRRKSLKAINRILKRRVECFALHRRVSLSLHQHTHRWEQACYL